MDNYPKQVTKQCTEKILEQMNNAIYKINENNGKFEIGFFCLIKHQSEKIPVLMINKYIKDEDKEFSSSIKVSINQILKDLNDSQSKQDEDLRVIKEDISNLPTTIKNAETTITQSISNTEKTLSSVLSQIKTDVNACINKGNEITRDISSLQETAGAIQSAIADLSSTQSQIITSAKDEIITSISEKSSSLNASIESLKATCQTISSSITNHAKELKDEIVAARNESAKASKINRIILIIGIIVLAILQLLIK